MESVWIWIEGEVVRIWEEPGRETVMGIYCMKKNLLSIKEKIKKQFFKNK